MQGLCESYRSAMEKLDDPCSQLTFLGFKLVSMALSIWLPEEKSTELRQMAGANVRLKEEIGVPGGEDWPCCSGSDSG